MDKHLVLALRGGALRGKATSVNFMMSEVRVKPKSRRCVRSNLGMALRSANLPWYDGGAFVRFVVPGRNGLTPVLSCFTLRSGETSPCHVVFQAISSTAAVASVPGPARSRERDSGSATPRVPSRRTRGALQLAGRHDLHRTSHHPGSECLDRQPHDPTAAGPAAGHRRSG